MGRAPLGRSKKSEVITVRITADEKAMLEAKYGTAAKGFRALLATLPKGK